MNEPSARERWICALLMAVLALVAWRRLHVPAWNASDLRIAPDAVEFAVASERLAHLGSYSIEIEGLAHPPKSTSWFGPLFLTPVYALCGRELGRGIHVVFGFALLALAFAFALGRRIGGALGGAAAALALLLHPQFEAWSREILSDVPGLALGLGAAWLYVRKPCERSTRDDALAGAVVALAFAVRNVYAAALLPFLWSWWRDGRRGAPRLAALLAPSALVLGATCIYDARHFGSVARTGYHYWCAVPYDYPGLAFGLRYLPDNLRAFAEPALWVPLAALALAAPLARRNAPARALLLFTLLAAFPGTLLHLVHFYPDVRFHLLLIGLALVGALGVAASFVPQRAQRFAWLAAPLVALAAWWPTPPDLREPGRRLFAEALLRATPDDAVIVTTLEPVFLEPWFRGSHRRVVPAHRGIEYASKLVAPRRIDAPVPMPTDPFEHRAAGLRTAGAREAVEFTASERPDELARWVREGRPVFVDSTFEAQTGILQLLRGRGLTWKAATADAAIVQLAPAGAPR